MNLSTADLGNYRTEFHKTWWSYRYMFLVDPRRLKNLYFVTIAAIFHKRPGLATISLKVDHICIISIKFGGNWLCTGF
jgi:hypothetical protein